MAAGFDERAAVKRLCHASLCVPATEFDDSGARLEAKDLLRLSEDSAVLGLGEMMNVAGVCDGDAGVFAKLNAFQDKIVDGHAPGLVGKDLQAYLLAGIATDHECSEPEEALEQLRSGMNLMVRRGSGAKNGEVLISTLLDSHISTGRVCFCTDDKHVEDIRREGHISSNIREAIHLGMRRRRPIVWPATMPRACTGFPI